MSEAALNVPRILPELPHRQLLGFILILVHRYMGIKQQTHRASWHEARASWLPGVHPWAGNVTGVGRV